jgi:hypothetical protein
MGSEIAWFEMFARAASRRYAESALPGAPVRPDRERLRSLRRLVGAVRGPGEEGRLAVAWPGRGGAGSRGAGWRDDEGDAADDR